MNTSSCDQSLPVVYFFMEMRRDAQRHIFLVRLNIYEIKSVHILKMTETQNDERSLCVEYKKIEN